MGSLLRPILLFVTFTTVLLASLIVMGRVTMTFLHVLEDELNVVLRPGAVELGGLRGSWHRLDPVVEVESVRFAGGQARSVALEVDLLESLGRGGLVLRAARVGSLELALVRLPDGRWNLGSAAQGGTRLPLEDLLFESDALSLPAVVLRLLDQAEGAPLLLAEYQLAASLENRNGWHRGRVIVAEGAKCGECRIALGWELDGLTMSSIDEGRVTATAREFSMPRELGEALGLAGFIADGEVVGRVDDGRGAARLRLALRDVTLPFGHLNSIHVAARGGARLPQSGWARVDSLSLAGDGTSLGLDGATVAVDLEQGVLDVNVPAFEVARAAKVVQTAGAELSDVVRWIDALEPRGAIDGLAIRLEPEQSALSFTAELDGGAIEGYRGVPEVSGARARLLGYERGLALVLNGDPVEVGLLDLFDSSTAYERAKGRVQLWFGSEGYLGVRGAGLSVVAPDHRASGGFAISRPLDPLEQRVIASVNAHDMSAAVALSYLPRKLPEPLLRWIGEAGISGQIESASFVSLGHVLAVDPLTMRRAELAVTFSDMDLTFQPDWPRARGLEGKLVVGKRETHAELIAGRLGEVPIETGTLLVPRGADYARLHGEGSTDAGAALALVRASPLAQPLQQTASWVAEGPVRYAADLTVPLRGDPALLAVALDADLAGVTVAMNDVELTPQQLRGRMSYRHPYLLTAADLQGELFSRPARFAIDSGDGEIRVEVNGHATVDEISSWLGVKPGIFAGDLDFGALLRIAPAARRPAVLEVTSDLEGIAIDLPAELGKTPSESRPARMQARFEQEAVALSFDTAEASGWLRVVGGRPSRGAIGIGVLPEPENAGRDGLLITGRLGELEAAQWLALPGVVMASALPRLEVREFVIERLRIQDLTFPDVRLSARGGGQEGMRLSATGPAFAGQFEAEPGQVPRLLVSRLDLPGAPTDARSPAANAPVPGEGPSSEPGAAPAGSSSAVARGPVPRRDPLRAVDPRSIPELDLEIAGVTIGGADRGRWKFGLRRHPEGVVATNLTGDVNGLHIEAPTGVLWSSGRSRFSGRITAGDLSDVLTAFGYAPSVESDSVKLEADLAWPGSPLNFSLADLSGALAFVVKDGRFVDIAGASAGGTRIFSLLNFSAIAKRMSLDFSDVFGKGISFDEMSAKTEIDDSLMRFVEPLEVDGTGSSFKVSGTVDLERGALDNEMIVTLPVSESLPWYAAYLGIFASPIAAGAVIVGERIFRDQIEQFSSAKYRIDGTLDDPKVSFVRVFTTAMDEGGQTGENGPARSEEATSGAESANKTENARGKGA